MSEIVKRQVTSVIQVGKDVYTVKATEDGRGVVIQTGETTLFIPAGEQGNAILGEASTLLPVATPAPRAGRRAAATAAPAPRKRRSASEMEALRAAGQAPPKRVYKKAGETPAPETV